jgi:hypothetical protein
MMPLWGWLVVGALAVVVAGLIYFAHYQDPKGGG